MITQLQPAPVTDVRILYIVHDLADAAVQRRTAMLLQGGAAVTLMGFRRTGMAPSEIVGCPVIDLGRTHNANFGQRVRAVLHQILRLRFGRLRLPAADVVIARNLEMLAIAANGIRGLDRKPVLIYESLDIHRLLLDTGLAGRLLRRLEGLSARSASGLLTSSPAFVTHYFQDLARFRLPVYLVENKVYPRIDVDPGVWERPPATPWRIVWAGMIRCRRSLEMLARLAADNVGKIEIIIHGRPSYDVLPGFEAVVDAHPNLSFLGPYEYPEGLCQVYGTAHFSWAMDFFEEGLNSSWLLPNRIYEGGLFNVPPIVDASVETGRYLRELGVGIELRHPIEDSLHAFFDRLTVPDYERMTTLLGAMPRSTWCTDAAECAALVEFVGSPGSR